MADPLASLLRPHRGPILPALERLAPAPSDRLVAAEIEARTNAGDVVIELHGRGGWIARAAIDRFRRAYGVESTALTRLVAELVLRPPDLRHLDAALNGIANQPRGASILRDSINAGFASRCGACGSPVLVDEFIWEADAATPTRRSYRCGHCRDARTDGRTVPVDRDDAARAAAADASAARLLLEGRFPVFEKDHPLPGQILDLYSPRALDAIAAIVEHIESELRAPGIQAALRLAVVHMLLPASKLNSYPGRVAQLRISNGNVRPPGSRQWRERNPWLLFEEGCRSVRAFVQRLEGATGARSQARMGSDLAGLLDGSANVVLRQGGSADVLRIVAPARGAAATRDRDPRSRIRLVLTQPPLHWTPENLGFAYLAASVAAGHAAATTLPLETLFRPQPRGEWAWHAAVLRRSLETVRDVLAADGRIVVLLDRSVPGALVAAVLGGIGAGYRLLDAVLAESGDEITGTLEFGARGLPTPADRGLAPIGATERGGALRLSAVMDAIGDIAVAVLQRRGEPARYERLLGEVLVGLDHRGYLGRLVAGWPPAAGRAAVVRRADQGQGQAPGATPAAPVQPAPAPAAMGAGAAAAQAFVPASSGEAAGAAAIRSWRDPSRPVREAPALGAPDSLEPDAGPLASAAGQGPSAVAVVGGAPQPGGPIAASADIEEPVPGPGGAPRQARAVSISPRAIAPARTPAAAAGPATAADPAPAAAGDPVAEPELSAVAESVGGWADVATGADPVRLVLEIVTGELRRTDHPRLVELEPGRWWVRDASDMDAARPPLSDRLEWAVFSLLATAGGISEAAFFRRVAGMFRGHDTPDAELVRACLESYRADTPDAQGTLHAQDVLPVRFEEHGATVGMLTDLGHRLGLRCWISGRDQRRPYRQRPLGELLSDVEQRVYLPLVYAAPAEALESIDCIWYLRGKATFLFDVLWTAMLSDPILRRGPRIPTSDRLVRFLVVPHERTELVRFKLARSPLLRERMAADNWHILKSDHVRRLVAREEVGLDDLAPLLGLDPEIERRGDQLSLFA